MPLPTMPLLDQVKQGSASLASTSGPMASQTGLQTTGGENTAQVQKLTSAAQTGKELGPTAGGGAGLSAIGEKLAALNTRMQASAIQEGGLEQSTAQQQQAAAQQQSFTQQADLISQKRLDMRADFNNKLNGMVQQSQEQLQSLTQQDNRSKAEQMGTLMRLSSDQYVTKLNDAATRARLADASQFKVTLAATVFDQESDLLGSNLQFRNILQQDHRAAVASVANMDLDFAMALATAQNKSAAGTQMWSGIGSVGGAAASAGVTYANSLSEAEAPPQDNSVMQSSQNGPGTGAATQSYDPMAGLPSSGDTTPAYSPPGGG